MSMHEHFPTKQQKTPMMIQDDIHLKEIFVRYRQEDIIVYHHADGTEL